jgi:DNA-binding MarR family transcriptional regulator
VDGFFDIGKIDEVIHGRVRLGVMAFLTATEIADFNTLKDALSVTEGTLSVHLRKLEEAGHIRILKGFRGRRPLTQAKLTPKGRRAFAKYLDTMAELVDLRGQGTQ